MSDPASPSHVPYVTSKQEKRIKHLRDDFAYHQRALKEIASPIAKSHEEAQLALANAVDELGVPADGRVIQFKERTDERGEAGIYFETLDWKLDPQTETWMPRPQDEKLKWIAYMATKGVTIAVPLKPEVGQNGTDHPVPETPAGVSPATHDRVADSEEPAAQPPT